MSKCFNFAEFHALCPVNHQALVSQLVELHFPALTAKRRVKAENNLDMIISVTFELSASMGFAKMSMRDLHQASGLSLGGLYNYFSNKETLALMIAEGLHLIAFDWLPTLMNSKHSAREQLERLIRGHVYLSELLRPWFYFVFMESKNLPEQNKSKAREVELGFQARLKELLKDEGLMANHIMAMIQDWHVKHWKYRNTDIDDFADSLVRFSLASLPD